MSAENGATFKLRRTRQCKHCPWRVATDPHDIPDGYSVERHHALIGTIARPGSLVDSLHVMACHESPPGRESYCIGWLSHQLGPGNNISLRLLMRNCENIGRVRLDGLQHETFEDTLP